MKGDRVEAVVDTGHAVQTFEIVASRAGRRIEVTSGRGIVEVTEVTRGGTPVRTARFMASRLIALVEHPAMDADGAGVDVTTRRRMGVERRPVVREREAVQAAARGAPAARHRTGRDRAERVRGERALGDLRTEGDEDALEDRAGAAM